MQAERSVFPAAATIFDLQVFGPFALLAAILACGAIAIALTYRWYRNLKSPSSSAQDDLVQLTRALENPEGLAPEEVDRIKATIERLKEETK